MTQSPRWCYRSIKRNIEFYTCGIIASSDIPNTATLEHAGDKQTQIPPKGHKGRRNTELNACGICASYRCPYLQHATPNTEGYLDYFSC